MPDRALIYVRQSLARPGETADTSLSLDSQEDACRTLCDRHGWTVVAVIRDHDVRGSDPARPGMLDLMDRARRRDVDAVVVFAMSRFARDAPYQELTWRELRRLGVRVESLNEPNIEHTLIRGMLGVVNQYRSEEIGQHVAAAVRRNAAQGKWHGTPPYGYTRDDQRRLMIVANEANIIRELFQRFADGWSVAALHQWLNTDPTVPPRRWGGRWGVGTVRAILRNETYRGVLAVAPGVAGAAAFAPVRIEGAHEAIVSAELWERVRRRMADGRPASRGTVESHWLEGHVWCRCGEPMYHVGRKDRTARQWLCRARALHRTGDRAHDCPEPIASAGAGWVERGTLALLGATLARAGTIPDDDLRRAVAKPDRRAETAERELADLRRQQTNLVEALAHGVPAATVAPKLAVLAERIAAAERTAAAYAPTRTLDDLRLARRYAADLAGLVGGLGPAGLRAVCERMGLRVTVEPGEWRVTLGFGPGFDWLGEPTRALKRRA